MGITTQTSTSHAQRVRSTQGHWPSSSRRCIGQLPDLTAPEPQAVSPTPLPKSGLGENKKICETTFTTDVTNNR